MNLHTIGPMQRWQKKYKLTVKCDSNLLKGMFRKRLRPWQSTKFGNLTYYPPNNVNKTNKSSCYPYPDNPKMQKNILSFDGNAGLEFERQVFNTRVNSCFKYLGLRYIMRFMIWVDEKVPAVLYFYKYATDLMI